jgi:hypothetical protein
VILPHDIPIQDYPSRPCDRVAASKHYRGLVRQVRRELFIERVTHFAKRNCTLFCLGVAVFAVVVFIVQFVWGAF